MRSPRELVAELAAEAPRMILTAIVVAFEDETKLVFHRALDDGKPVRELEALISEGGEPVGLVACKKIGRQLRFYSRAFAEYADQDWVGAYLESFSGRLREVCAASGLMTHTVDPFEN